MVLDWKYKLTLKFMAELRLCTPEQQQRVLTMFSYMLQMEQPIFPVPSFVGVTEGELVVRFERMEKSVDIIYPLSPQTSLKLKYSKLIAGMFQKEKEQEIDELNIVGYPGLVLKNLDFKVVIDPMLEEKETKSKSKSKN